MPRAVDVLLPLPLAPLRWLAPFASGAAGGGADGDAPDADADAVAGARADDFEVGAWVVVPWRGGIRAGLVTGVGEAGASRALELKEALQRLDEAPPLPAATVAWLLAEAERTACPPGVVLAGLAPSAARADLDHRVRELDPAGGEAGPWRAAGSLDPARLELLRGQGLLDERVRVAVPTRRVLVPAGDPDDPALGGARQDGQRRALARLVASGGADSGAALARDADVSESAVRTLVRKGLARYGEVQGPPAAPPDPPAPLAWPDEATAVLARDADAEAGASPRNGHPDDDPPGAWIAGGTEASRLAALLPELRRDVAAGRSPVVLAPERRLAEEAAARLAGTLRVHLVRAGDAPRTRLAAERALAAAGGDPGARDAGARVVVGTWPVLAAPLASPGRLVVLEAGSEAHKARSGARVWAPIAARGWARAHGVPLRLTDVLAGPETRALVRDDALGEVATPGAPGRTLPRPRVRWILSDLGRTRSWPLGDEAIRVLRQVEARGRQALLLVPRRGFSAALGCRDCGAAVMCPNCDLALRWHARDARLRCHQCGHEAAPPATCPACGGPELEAQRAAGSEWVLRTLAQAVPGLPRYRWDGDVRDDPAPLLAGEPGVVVGTTAVLALPRLPVLSLLVATQVDGALHADDFRAEERVLRTLAALEEAAGERAPLGLIQTFAPEHAALAAFASGRPERLEAALEAMDARRRRFGYPPYGAMARIQASARRPDAARRAADAAADRLRAAGATEAELLGPAPAPVGRVRGRTLVHLLLLTQGAARRRELLAAALGPGQGGATLRVDVDPRDIGEVLDGGT